jgi:NTP pyrophosphatase (non-canonical NTP hydrolase)
LIKGCEALVHLGLETNQTFDEQIQRSKDGRNHHERNTNFCETISKKMGWEISEESYAESRASLLNNYMLLTTEVAEVAEELRKSFNLTAANVENGMDEEQAFELAKSQIKENIGKELSDCLAYMLKFYNYFGIDAEESFYAKMEEVKNRKNKDLVKPNK